MLVPAVQSPTSLVSLRGITLCSHTHSSAWPQRTLLLHRSPPRSICSILNMFGVITAFCLTRHPVCLQSTVNVYVANKPTKLKNRVLTCNKGSPRGATCQQFDKRGKSSRGQLSWRGSSDMGAFILKEMLFLFFFPPVCYIYIFWEPKTSSKLKRSEIKQLLHPAPEAADTSSGVRRILPHNDDVTQLHSATLCIMQT